MENDSVESQVKTIIAVQLGVIGLGVGRSIKFVEPDIAKVEGYAVQRRFGEDWHGDARRHHRRLRNRTHRRVIRPKGR